MHRGYSFLKFCESEIELTLLPVEDALNPQQGNLLNPSTPHVEREKFKKKYPKYGFYKTIRKTYLGKEILKREKVELLKRSRPYRALKKVYKMVKGGE